MSPQESLEELQKGLQALQRQNYPDAIAYLETLCPQLTADQRIIINCSGRGDKDVNTVIQHLHL